MKKLEEGSKAPDFKALDQNGKSHKLSDYMGKWILLYFYPKDDTPGCTKEACSIRDSWPDFKKLKLEVFGISIQDEKSHKKFSEKYDLPFTLLVDDDKKIVEKYGVWAEKSMYGRKYMGTLRNSYLVNPKGKIEKIYQKVNPVSHVEEVLEDLKKLR
ncbi:MAG TPA: thioredoxin-dependent thiol peroxidase [Candidatus Paceibacterota bacterium]